MYSARTAALAAAPSGPPAAPCRATARPAPAVLPERGGAHVWFGDDRGAVLRQDMELLSEEERGRCLRFSRHEDRRRFAASWAAVRRTLAAYADVEPGEIRFGRTGTAHRGRLRHQHLVLVAASVPQVFLSVARSEEFWLLGLSVDDPIGVDLEHVRDFDTEGLIDRCLAPEEQLQVRELPPESRRAAFVRAWTRKEAVMKAAGLPLTTAPHRVPVHPGRSGPVHVELQDQEWAVYDLPRRGPVLGAFARPLTGTGPVLVHDTMTEESRA
ncbi:4'-phosphopantetheinyl transferase family protein [Streptomyces sp. NPDC088762]|uniref:4'-phosphopantetheinyl transferase family protein n=1 Tax=Streptomyces sp. NPDC088762 TaxID=3365891 RepID=UPI0038068729